MLLQAFDFVYLYDKYNCELQVGGSDQWGNITAGIDLARRMRGVQLYGMTCPLLTKTDGTKMGKTETGTLWLSAERTSPYQFYQYWIRVEDADVGKCLRMLTTLPHEEIESLDASRAADAAKRDSQRRLAEELTQLVHGDAGLPAAMRATEIFYGAEIADLTTPSSAKSSPTSRANNSPATCSRRDGGLPIVDALVAAGLAKAKATPAARPSKAAPTSTTAESIVSTRG